MTVINPFQRAADVLRDAEALFITAGAVIGVDSGLPDFLALVPIVESDFPDYKRAGQGNWSYRAA